MDAYSFQQEVRTCKSSMYATAYSILNDAELAAKVVDKVTYHLNLTYMQKGDSQIDDLGKTVEQVTKDFSYLTLKGTVSLLGA